MRNTNLGLLALVVLLLAGCALWVSVATTDNVGRRAGVSDRPEEKNVFASTIPTASPAASPAPSPSPSRTRERTPSPSVSQAPVHYTAEELAALKAANPNVAFILPRGLYIGREAAEVIVAYQEWKSRQFMFNDDTLASHLYVSAHGGRAWDWEEYVTAKGLSHVSVRSCGGSDTPEVSVINCLAESAVQDGASHVCLIDEAEFWEGAEADEAGRRWVAQAVVDLLHVGLDWRFYVEPVRHLGVAGRGAQWRSRVTVGFADVWPHFAEEVERRAAAGEAAGDYYQYKFLNQMSGSVCVHRQHVEAMGEMLHPEMSVEEGIDWATAIYAHNETHVSPWPEAYGDYDSFMSAMNASYVYNAELLSTFRHSRLDLYEAKIKWLMDYHGVRGCEAFEELEVDKFVPESTSHSTKTSISVGYLDGEKVFVSALLQGGPQYRRRNSDRNAHALLMLHDSPYFPTLRAYCDEDLDRRTAVVFIEGNGDIDIGLKEATCVERLEAALGLIHSLKDAHAIGLIQCDWKASQWLLTEDGSVKMVDVDDMIATPTDCGMSEGHTRLASENINQIDERAHHWNTTTKNTILEEQFLMVDDNDWPRMDFRHDIYELSRSLAYKNMLLVGKPCRFMHPELTDFVNNLGLVYPLSEDEIIAKLQGFLARAEEEERKAREEGE